MASNIHWCIKSVDGKDGSVSHNAKLVKNGHTRTGKQRYKCLQCGKTMLFEYTNNACSLGRCRYHKANKGRYGDKRYCEISKNFYHHTTEENSFDIE